LALQLKARSIVSGSKPPVWFEGQPVVVRTYIDSIDRLAAAAAIFHFLHST